jgi:AcrR family transcriptional regulator
VRAEPGLRERKKHQTRQLIVETARRLFAESGFDAVTVAEIARAASVSEGTVFNYFPTKESLVFQGMEDFEAALLDAIRHRQPGEPVLTAFGRFLTESSLVIAARGNQVVAMAAHMIAASPALRAREREIIESYTQALADVIAEETGAALGDIEPWVAANALMGIHRAILDSARRAAIDRHAGLDIADEVVSQAERGLARLRRGLGDYAIRSQASYSATAPDPQQGLPSSSRTVSLAGVRGAWISAPSACCGNLPRLHCCTRRRHHARRGGTRRDRG